MFSAVSLDAARRCRKVSRVSIGTGRSAQWFGAFCGSVVVKPGDCFAG